MSKARVRYMIDDVPAAVRFYTTLLGFTLEQDASPAFAAVVRDGVHLLLNGEGSSGKRPLPDGRQQVPGGWTRCTWRWPISLWRLHGCAGRGLLSARVTW